jgi:hypothetical protein
MAGAVMSPARCITWMGPHNVAVQIDGRHLHIGGESLFPWLHPAAPSPAAAS